MIDLIIESLERDNWIDWGVILQTWKGLPYTDYRLSADYVADFAIKEIEKVKDDISPDLIELSHARFLERDRITVLLEEICAIERIEEEISLKKWRIATLEKTIDRTSDDFICILMELNNFWSSWGNPDDKPHIIQSLDSNMNQTEYYSEENYEKLLKAHQVWIEQERKAISYNLN